MLPTDKATNQGKFNSATSKKVTSINPERIKPQPLSYISPVNPNKFATTTPIKSSTRRVDLVKISNQKTVKKEEQWTVPEYITTRYKAIIALEEWQLPSEEKNLYVSVMFNSITQINYEQIHENLCTVEELLHLRAESLMILCTLLEKHSTVSPYKLRFIGEVGDQHKISEKIEKDLINLKEIMNILSQCDPEEMNYIALQITNSENIIDGASIQQYRHAYQKLQMESTSEILSTLEFIVEDEAIKLKEFLSILHSKTAKYLANCLYIAQENLRNTSKDHIAWVMRPIYQQIINIKNCETIELDANYLITNITAHSRERETYYDILETRFTSVIERYVISKKYLKTWAKSHFNLLQRSFEFLAVPTFEGNESIVLALKKLETDDLLEQIAAIEYLISVLDNYDQKLAEKIKSYKNLVGILTGNIEISLEHRSNFCVSEGDEEEERFSSIIDIDRKHLMTSKKIALEKMQLLPSITSTTESNNSTIIRILDLAECHKINRLIQTSQEFNSDLVENLIALEQAVKVAPKHDKKTIKSVKDNLIHVKYARTLLNYTHEVFKSYAPNSPQLKHLELYRQQIEQLEQNEAHLSVVDWLNSIKPFLKELNSFYYDAIGDHYLPKSQKFEFLTPIFNTLNNSDLDNSELWLKELERLHLSLQITLRHNSIYPELTEFHRTALSMLNQVEPDSPEGRRWDILKNTSELFKSLLAQYWKLWENQPNEFNQKNLLEQIIDTERLLKQHKL